jgi:phenylpyruvate tautomerase
MPYLKIETNKKIDPQACDRLLNKLSDFIAILLNKPHKYIMVSVDHEKNILFASDTSLTAYITLKGIGLEQEKCYSYSHAICGFIESELGILPDRVFIDFIDLNRKMFGWNKGTF